MIFLFIFNAAFAYMHACMHSAKTTRLPCADLEESLSFAVLYTSSSNRVSRVQNMREIEGIAVCASCHHVYGESKRACGQCHVSTSAPLFEYVSVGIALSLGRGFSALTPPRLIFARTRLLLFRVMWLVCRFLLCSFSLCCW